MRVLLAVDGSPAARVATTLVSSLDWPAGSTIRVVAALSEANMLFGASLIPAAPTDLQRLEDDLLAAQETVVADAIDAIRRPGLIVDGQVLRGRPANVIVEDAEAFEADLVVVGSRGHGGFQSALLGSVSAEVVDHGPCPVLVARRGWIRSLVLADDGSDDAHRARRIVRDWPILRDVPTCVVSVVRVPSTWEPALVPGAGSLPTDPYVEALAESRRQHAVVARTSHDELVSGGRPCEYVVRTGDPGAEIVAAAIQAGADLIVLGSHGRTGLRRALLGSVARTVLMHASCSVLIVRHQAQDRVPLAAR